MGLTVETKCRRNMSSVAGTDPRCRRPARKSHCSDLPCRWRCHEVTVGSFRYLVRARPEPPSACGISPRGPGGEGKWRLRAGLRRGYSCARRCAQAATLDAGELLRYMCVIDAPVAISKEDRGSERTGTLAEVGEYLRAGGDDTDALGEDRFADGGWRGRRRWGRWRAVACGACAERSSWRGPFGGRRGPQPTWRRARTVRSCRWDWWGTESGHSTERVGGQGGLYCELSSGEWRRRRRIRDRGPSLLLSGSEAAMRARGRTLACRPGWQKPWRPEARLDQESYRVGVLNGSACLRFESKRVELMATSSSFTTVSLIRVLARRTRRPAVSLLAGSLSDDQVAGELGLAVVLGSVAGDDDQELAAGDAHAAGVVPLTVQFGWRQCLDGV